YDVLNTIGTPFSNSQVGIKNLESTDTLSFFTIGSGRDGFSFGGQYQFGGAFKNNQLQYGDHISWTKGKHAIRMGGEFEYVRFTQNYGGARGIGAPTFPRFADFLVGR